MQEFDLVSQQHMARCDLINDRAPICLHFGQLTRSEGKDEEEWFRENISPPTAVLSGRNKSSGNVLKHGYEASFSVQKFNCQHLILIQVQVNFSLNLLKQAKQGVHSLPYASK